MHYVYLLKSQKTNEAYVGSTADLKKRFSDHNLGKNKSTKDGLPWALVYYEAYKNRSLALEREKQLKRYGQALTRLKDRVDF